MALLKTNTGIGTTNPISALHVIGDGRFTGVVTAISFTGNLVGIATTALNLNRTITAGSGLTGGGELTADRTINVGAGTGITVNADDVALKNATSLTNNKVTKWDSGNGQLTDSSLTDTGTTVTIGTGVTFYVSSGIISATSFYGSGSNLTDLIADKIDGLRIQNEEISVGVGATFSTLNFVSDYVNAVGVGSTANIVFSNPPFASNSGISTNIKGGNTGDIPYQSATDTTTFLSASSASPNQILLWNGSAPVWSNVTSAAGAFGGISIQDEGNPVGTSNSITTLNFVSPNLSVVATSGANGIATIALSESIVGTALSISGISTLGVVTSGNIFSTGIITATQFSTGSGTLGFTTNTISGPSEIIIDPSPVGVGTTSGVVRIRGDLYVDGTQFVVNSSTIELADLRVGIATTVGTNALLDGGGIGIGSANILKTITWNNTASALTSSEDWNLASGKQYKINGTSVLTSTTLGSGVVNSSLTSVGTLGNLNVSTITSTNDLNVSGVGTFLSSGLKIRNPANTFGYTITGGAIVADRTLNLPVITGTDTVAVLGLNQTFSGTNTFSGTISATNAATITLAGGAVAGHTFGTNQTSGTLTFGGTSGTGLITFGRATTSQQTDIQAGASGVGTSKTINFGTGGLSGSNTIINVGPTAGIGTVSINTGTNLGIGSATPTSKLDVVGDAKFTGVVTATTFIGALTGTATTATNIDISATSSGDTTTYVVLVGNNVTGGQQPFIDNGSLTYNASTNVLTAGGGFSGDGSALTNLNGSQITSGTISGDRGVTSGSTSSSFIEYNGTTKTAGQFDGGTTDPNSTTRLNYDGYFYSTRLYSDSAIVGSAVTVNSSGINVTGIVTATDFNSASDAKLKTNIQPIVDPIGKITQINGVSFNWIKDNKPSMGVIADELQRVLPELVSDTDPKTVNYNGLIGLLIEVVKEQQHQIQSLEERITRLE